MHNNQSQEVFLQLYDRKIDEVFAHCMSEVADRELAKVLTQRVFARAWDKVANGTMVEEIEHQLFGIVAALLHREEDSQQISHTSHFVPALGM
jgi:hypothetical protein